MKIGDSKTGGAPGFRGSYPYCKNRIGVRLVDCLAGRLVDSSSTVNTGNTGTIATRVTGAKGEVAKSVL